MPHMEKKVYLHVCRHMHRSIDNYAPSLFLPLSQNLGIQVDIEKMISALEATVPPLYQQSGAQPPNYEMRIVTRFCAGTFGGISHRGHIDIRDAYVSIHLIGAISIYGTPTYPSFLRRQVWRYISRY